MVRTQRFHCRGLGSIPGWGTKIRKPLGEAKKKKKKNWRKSSGSRTRQRFVRLDTYKSMIYKGKNDELVLIKIKNFCSVKDPVKRMKRQAKDSEKIFANHISDKRPVSRNREIS